MLFRSVELTEEEFFTQRTEQLVQAAKQNINLYPHKFNVTDKLLDIKNYASGENPDQNHIVSCAARIVGIRQHSKLFFFTVISDAVEMQLMLNNGDEKLIKTANLLRRGDIVGFSGSCGRSKTSEPSVFLTELVLLTPCLRVIPTAKNGLKDAETIYRKRYLDLLVNKDSMERFKNRSKIIHHIRKFFTDMDFIEVETPIMDVNFGGAAARPFKTYHNELKSDMYLRVATELFLKKLVIGGFNRVFEIGKQFRNEGIDRTHNPEFTSLEFYMAYADYNDLMKITEDLLSGLAKEFKHSTKFDYTPSIRGQEVQSVSFDFSTPFKRLDILTELNKALNLNLTGENLTDPATLVLLKNACKERNIVVEEPQTLNRVLDKLMGEYVESQCINPTFVTGFPTTMSPLAKDDRHRVGITERFEVFLNTKEICNAYTELNIPSVQRERFRLQAVDQAAGDEEAMPVDEEFCHALEFGLPPTGGWGVGIDRLVMYLTDAANIRDVILFPTMKSEN